MEKDELIEETVAHSTKTKISRQQADGWKSHRSPGVTGFQKS